MVSRYFSIHNFLIDQSLLLLYLLVYKSANLSISRMFAKSKPNSGNSMYILPDSLPENTDTVFARNNAHPLYFDSLTTDVK